MKISFLRNDNPYVPLFSIGISVILLVADYFAGPFIQFPITYLVPISLASWYSGRHWGLTFAITLPLVRLFFNIALWTIPWTFVEATINCIIRITVFSLLAILIDRTASQSRELTQEVEILSGLLPICSFCKKIRDDKQQWQPIESYISKRSEASFSHGLCPDCAEKHYGKYLRKKS
ncbi:hypothetical protein JNM05_14230 [bacterium]|nr:hypothetical protein [bacterium]